MSDHPLVAAYAKIERLEFEIAELRREVRGRSWHGQRLDLKAAYGLTANEANLVLMLRAANGRPVSKDFLLESRPRQMDRKPDLDDELKMISVLIWKVRQRMGRDTVVTHWGHGYALSKSGMALVDEALREEVAA